MSHSPYEPEGVGRGVDPDPTVGAYGETYTQPVEDLYAPVTTTGTTQTSTGAGDVKDTAKDQGRRVADTAKEQAGQVKDTAVEQAGQVKDTALEQGQQVASVAKDQVGQVAQQAAGSIKDIVSEGRTQLTNQVGTSQNRIAEYVHTLADELGTMASGGGDGTGPLADLAHRGARTGGELSKWLSDHEPSDLLAEVTRFARRRPWAFLGASLLTGVVVGRVTRSLAAEAKDEHDAQQVTSTTSTPALSGPSYGAPVGQTSTTGYGTTGYESTTPSTGYTSGYVASDLPENPAPQTWTGGSR